MPTITAEGYRYFENKIHLPMLIKVLERDLTLFQKLPFKLNRPYIAKVENTLNLIRRDLKATNIYLVRYNMRLIQGKTIEGITEYTYINVGYEERHKFTSDQLRDKCEEILTTYLVK